MQINKHGINAETTINAKPCSIFFTFFKSYGKAENINSNAIADQSS